MSKGIMLPPFLAKKLGLSTNVVNKAWTDCGYKLGEISLEQSASVEKELERQGFIKPTPPKPPIKRGPHIAIGPGLVGIKGTRTYSLDVGNIVYLGKVAQNVSAYIDKLILEDRKRTGDIPAEEIKP